MKFSKEFFCFTFQDADYYGGGHELDAGPKYNPIFNQ